MKILFLTHRRDTPSTRYRVDQFLPLFRAEGHAVDVRDYSSSLLDLWPLFRAVKEADVTVLQKKLPPAWMTRAIRRRAKRFLYDFDDAIYLKRSDDGPRPWGVRVKRFEAVMRIADGIIAGNSFLADQARNAGAKHVTVIPTVIDPAKYLAAPKTPHEGVVAGWIGAGGNLPYLEALLPSIKSLPVKVRVVCNRFPEGVEKIEWAEATEAGAVAGMDFGLAPMPDDAWTRGKCGTRILQYFACGVPVVADDVGVHKDLVGDGGFLVSTPEQWLARMGELAADGDLRRRMGEAGRARLQARYTPQAVMPAWREILRG